MSPFRQLRSWQGRASVAEQASAAVGAVLVVAVVAWLLVPPTGTGAPASVAVGGTGAAAGSTGAGGSGSSSSSPGAGALGTGSSTGGGVGSPAGGGAVPASGSGGAAGATGAAPSGGGAPVAAGTGAGGCVSPPGGDQGVTQSQIRIAVILIQLVGPAANSTFGIPPPATQQADVQDVVDSINASGGVACRKLVPVFFTGDPADTSNLQQTCVNIIQAQPFFVVDLGAYYTYPQLAVCYPQAHIGYVNTGGLSLSQQRQFYPYDWGLFLYDNLYRDTVFGLKQRGFFSPSSGFRKLGVMYTSCLPDLPKQFTGWLNQAGVPSSAIVGHDVGCPTAFDSPGDLEQAILTFKQQGVTNVTFVHDTADFSNFTTIAQQQGFTPKYGIGDEGIVAISYGSQKPNYQNIANAVAITTYRYGEERTPGYPPGAGTQRCNAIFAAKGQPPVYQQPIGQGGIVCSLLWMVQGAIQHEPSLLRSNVAAGLQASKSVDFSFPYGPNDFSAPGTSTAGQFWRVDQFLPSCSCWQVVDRNYHPSA
ncbi:MAG TPA: hypothetical protein VFH50_03350 [Acidimicrobiales bacterium]|nr:hypothetical protein [Acidimicrobiales bacterium]